MPVTATPPAVIVHIAQRAQAQERGVVLYRLHRIFDVHAGPSKRHDESVLGVVAQDGSVVKVRVISASIGGKAADANTQAQIEHAYEHPAPGDLLDRPFDPRFIGDYTYAPVGAQAWHFESGIHDAAHAEGTMQLDEGGSVVTYTYRPYVLPKYSNTGTVTVTRAAVAPNYWAMTHELYQFSGRVAIFAGAATASISYDRYTRYPNTQAAEAALLGMTSAAGRLTPPLKEQSYGLASLDSSRTHRGHRRKMDRAR